MNVTKDMLTYTEEKELMWYGHMREAREGRWAFRVTKWSPSC